MSACEISRNAWDGILIAESLNLRFSGNLIEANDRHGLNSEWLHDGSKGLTVTGNRIQYNAGHGIQASAVKAWSESDNKMEGNGDNGINVLAAPIRQGQKD